MSHRRSHRTLALVAALALVLTAACGSDDDAADTDTTTTSAGGTDGTDGSEGSEGSDGTGGSDGDEGDPAGQLVEWSERGPHGVGSLQVALDDGRRVVVWYPAEQGAGTEEPTEIFDIASLLTPELQAKIPAEARVQYPVAAAPNAEPDPGDGPYPVILFSHGFAGFPEQSVGLTTHLASWGYVVAAPDHVERSLSGLLGTGAQGVEPREDPEVLAATLDLVEAQSGDESSPLADLVDVEKVAVAGHSAGAGASYRMASTDDRIDAFALYSIGSGSDENPLPEPEPTQPALVMLGDRDGVIEPDATREVYEGLGAPKYLAEVGNSGHLVFSDLCLIGADQGGLIGIVEEIDLDIPDNLKRLGSDGCDTEDYLPVDEAFPPIDALSVAFFRTYLDEEDGAADALTAGPVEGLDSEGEVTLTAEP